MKKITQINRIELLNEINIAINSYYSISERSKQIETDTHLYILSWVTIINIHSASSPILHNFSIEISKQRTLHMKGLILNCCQYTYASLYAYESLYLAHFAYSNSYTIWVVICG